MASLHGKILITLQVYYMRSENNMKHKELRQSIGNFQYDDFTVFIVGSDGEKRPIKSIEILFDGKEIHIKEN